MNLADVAPRLALARDQRRQELLAASRRRRRLLAAVLDAERLVAHRDLQLARAWTFGRGEYIAKRTRLLADARGQLRRAERRARDAGVRLP